MPGAIGTFTAVRGQRRALSRPRVLHLDRRRWNPGARLGCVRVQRISPRVDVCAARGRAALPGSPCRQALRGHWYVEVKKSGGVLCRDQLCSVEQQRCSSHLFAQASQLLGCSSGESGALQLYSHVALNRGSVGDTQIRIESWFPTTRLGAQFLDGS